MKTHVLLATVLALTSVACAGTKSDETSQNDSRQAAMQDDPSQPARAERADGEPSLAQGDSDSAEHNMQQGARPADTARAADTDGRDQTARADESASADERANDNAEHEADNTGRNARDDEPGKLTALDQSNSGSDIDITQAIRKKVVADEDLSFNAKNVKIITLGGKVTLRGPVASREESAAIEQSARAVPGVVQVDNQIEVKR
jgi:osmotically-inducible protein OsmY